MLEAFSSTTTKKEVYSSKIGCLPAELDRITLKVEGESTHFWDQYPHWTFFKLPSYLPMATKDLRKKVTIASERNPVCVGKGTLLQLSILKWDAEETADCEWRIFSCDGSTISVAFPLKHKKHQHISFCAPIDIIQSGFTILVSGCISEVQALWVLMSENKTLSMGGSPYFRENCVVHDKSIARTKNRNSTENQIAFTAGPLEATLPPTPDPSPLPSSAPSVLPSSSPSMLPTGILHTFEPSLSSQHKNPTPSPLQQGSNSQHPTSGKLIPEIENTDNERRARSRPIALIAGLSAAAALILFAFGGPLPSPDL
jgi:hypothetical protein